MKSITWVTFAVLLGLLPLGTLDGETRGWPQWRGPDRDGTSTETGLQRQWPAGGPSRVWYVENIGLGYAGPAVVGERLFVMGAYEGRERLLALDVKDGSRLWSSEIGKTYDNSWGNGPRGTPAVDGDFVYALGAEGTLLCARAADGAVIWRRRMQEFGGETPDWGYSESVLVDGPRVICTPGGVAGALLALDKRTGDVIWQSDEFTDGAQYSSALVIEHAGVRQYVQRSKSHTVGVAAESGRVLWTDPFPGRTAVIPTPIFADGFVFVTAGYNAGCELLALDDSGKVDQVYANRNMKNQHGGVVRFGGHLYGYSDGRGWVCQELATGEVVWSERDKLGKGCLVGVDGMLYLVGEQEGEVVLIDASPDGWQEHGRFTLSPQTKQRSPRGGIWTHPVVVHGRLYLRDQELLFSFDVRT